MSFSDSSAVSRGGTPVRGIETPKTSALIWNLGRHVFGVAALATGVVTLAWRNYNASHHLRYILFAAAVGQILGGGAIQFRRSAKTGAAILGAGYLVLVLLLVPPILAAPLTFPPWGDFFEFFSVLVGAGIVYAALSSWWTTQTVSLIGRILLGVCSVTFALYQALYLPYTASLVPKWFPPSQMFWAVATTIFFALGALALLANVKTLLATRLLTLMIVLFGLIVWVPRLVANPRSNSNWIEITENFAIAGALWIFADLLGRHQLNSAHPR